MLRNPIKIESLIAAVIGRLIEEKKNTIDPKGGIDLEIEEDQETATSSEITVVEVETETRRKIPVSGEVLLEIETVKGEMIRLTRENMADERIAGKERVAGMAINRQRYGCKPDSDDVDQRSQKRSPPLWPTRKKRPNVRLN